MKTLLPPHYVPEEVSSEDARLASIFWGFTIGFGWLTTWKAIRQSMRVWNRHGRGIFRSAFIWMIWLEILVCLIFGIICYLHLVDIIPPR